MTVSFIVPVYNTAPYLARCLDSLLSQEGDFEIVAVNDGSTDESAEILTEYQNRHPDRIRIVTQENGGLSAARNAGLSVATGEYLAFVDSDDTLSPEFLRECTAALIREPSDMLLFDYYYDYGDRLVPAVSSKGLSPDPCREALLSAPMVCTRLFSRKLFEHLRFTPGIYYEDLALTPLTVLSRPRVTRLNKPLYRYFQREGSIMHKREFSPRLLDIFTVLDSVLCAFEKEGLREEYRDELEYLYLEHLYRSAALRFSLLPQRRELFCRLRETVTREFPRWRKNPYLKQVSPFFRLTVMLTAHGCYRTVAALARWKGSV